MNLPPEDQPDPSNDPASGPVLVPDDAAWVMEYGVAGASIFTATGDVVDVITITIAGYLNGAGKQVGPGGGMIPTVNATLLIARPVAEQLLEHLAATLRGEHPPGPIG